MITISSYVINIIAMVALLGYVIPQLVSSNSDMNVVIGFLLFLGSLVTVSFR